MIEQLEIRDFQAHAKLVVDLSNPITTIVGPSDSGKSAILRALRWCALNQPSGSAFLRDGAQKVSVALTVDGEVIRRSSNGSANAYRNGNDVYKAFKRDVPPTIAALLKLSEINFQGQHEAPFWFSLSPAECSRQLNSIVNLDLIDQMMSNLDSMLRSSRAVTAEREERFNAAKEARKALAFVPQIVADLETVKQLDSKRWLLKTEKETLELDIQFLDEASTYLEEWKQIQSEIEPILQLAERLDAASKQESDLSELIEHASYAQSIAGIECPDITFLEEKANALSGLLSERERLGKLYDSAVKAQALIDINRAHADRLEERIQKLTNGACPVCGQPMT